MGDPERLQECLAALIENALHYSPTPQPVSLAADQQGDSLVLHVCDQGPGVEAGSVQVAEVPVGGADFQLHLPLARPLGVVSA